MIAEGTLALKEYQPCRSVPLSPEQVAALQRIAATAISITPSSLVPGTFDLTPGSCIGTIALPNLTITIRPKLPIDRVLFLISYAIDRGRWRDESTPFSGEQDLFETIVPGFVRAVQRATRLGLLHGYLSVEESATTVRGRIQFDEQLRRRPGIALPVEIRYDHFTEDIPENRLIYAAIRTLQRLPLRSQRARKDLARLSQQFANVSLVRFHPRQLPRITYTRLNRHYQPAVELAKLILRHATIELASGSARSSAFLIDMDHVFEDFVYLALRDQLRLTEREFPPNARGRTVSLDEAGRIRLEPDLSWWRGETCVFVGDAKYKRTHDSKGTNPDLYQLWSYMTALNLPSGLLVYAAGEADYAEHVVRHAGRRLQVVPLDLFGTPQDILIQAGLLARRIRPSRAF